MIFFSLLKYGTTADKRYISMQDAVLILLPFEICRKNWFLHTEFLLSGKPFRSFNTENHAVCPLNVNTYTKTPVAL